MATSFNYDIFISHASEDKDLALYFKNLLCDCFGNISIFCSSDSGDVEGGEQWFKKVMSAIKKTKVTLCLLTPSSIYRPWVLFESGGAYSLFWPDSKSRCLIPTCAKGITKKNLTDSPFNQLWIRLLTDSNEVLILLEQISKVLNRKLEKKDLIRVDKLCKLAKGSNNWQNIHQSLIGNQLRSTPFNAESLLTLACNHFFTAGPNLHFLASSSRCKKALFSWLKTPHRHAEIMLCDPNNIKELRIWSAVGKTFEKDLREAHTIFKKWREEAKTARISDRLDIRVTKLVTTGFMAIDPNEDIGRIVVTPIVVGKQKAHERPHIVLDRSKDSQPFKHYWEAYKDTFKNAFKMY